MKSALHCEVPARRTTIREKSELNGLDYLEVSDDQRSLAVYFLLKAPPELRKENIVIRGGRRVTDIRVVGIDVCPNQDPERDDCLRVDLDRPGDFTCYELCVVALDEAGRPTGSPHPGFDPRYACLSFGFKAGCPSDLDCLPLPCPPAPFDEPEIGYLAKDYASFRQLLLDRLALLVPDWRERHVPDLGITLVELLAYVGDHLSYYQDAVATEAYLASARQRISVRRHARFVDYLMHEGCNARAFVHLRTGADFELELESVAFVTSLRGLLPDAPRVLKPEALRELGAGSYEWFEPLWPESVRLRRAHNEICFYTWGDKQCCLLRGATRATLRDAYRDEVAPPPAQSSGAAAPKQAPPPPERPRALELEPGDVLVFEETLGPRTGSPADADPQHRHAVRLTRVTPAVDALVGQPVVEIEWHEADALPFALCLAATSDAPECRELACASVARGNVVLVDHGRTLGDDLGEVPCVAIRHRCESECPEGALRSPGRFRPVLTRPGLGFREPLDAAAPAARLVEQDPRKARPDVSLRSAARRDALASGLAWAPVPDLLASRGDDAHFVVEVDDDGRGHLRFGDGELGRAPDAEHVFAARYRVGNGPAGNVGAEAIAHLVTEATLGGSGIEPRNPLPARGGTPPEPVEDVKLLAPFAFRQELQRAITPRDYASLAERDFAARVQRAAARLRWTGSWYELDLALDAAGAVEAGSALLSDVEQRLERYRRIAHDLRVRGAVAVPLDLRLVVCVEPHALRGHVEAALLRRFGSRLLPDGTRGFFHPDNLSFGEGVFVSRLVAAARSVAGVENVVVERLRRYAGPDEGAVAAGVLRLAAFEIARLDNDPSFPENGVLELDMRGGR
jgi:hypothetical protein